MSDYIDFDAQQTGLAFGQPMDLETIVARDQHAREQYPLEYLDDGQHDDFFDFIEPMSLDDIVANLDQQSCAELADATFQQPPFDEGQALQPDLSLDFGSPWTDHGLQQLDCAAADDAAVQDR